MMALNIPPGAKSPNLPGELGCNTRTAVLSRLSSLQMREIVRQPRLMRMTETPEFLSDFPECAAGFADRPVDLIFHRPTDDLHRNSIIIQPR